MVNEYYQKFCTTMTFCHIVKPGNNDRDFINNLNVFFHLFKPTDQQRKKIIILPTVNRLKARLTKNSFVDSLFSNNK